MINFHAIAYFPVVLMKRRLMRPDVTVGRLADIDLASLAAAGATGILIDFDDTLIASRSGELYPDSVSFVDRCVDIWGDRVKIFSDSVGTHRERGAYAAEALKERLGIETVVHGTDKPGGIGAVRAAFGDSVDGLVVVGDRLLTDIVFGNRFGLRTIWVRHEHSTAPLSRFERWLAGR
jgi:phosphatidylglycerophosphatase GEP4